jgi:hypothetical protein
MRVSGDDVVTILKALWPWLIALTFAALPVVGALVSDSDMAKWAPAYVAGGLGGVVLELLLSRWQLELPSSNPKPAREPARPTAEEEEDSDSAFAFPTGSRVDLGFFGRFFTAGLAAVVFIILGAVVFADESLRGLQANAESNLTIAWAVAIGAASPAVWRALRRIVDARIASVRRQYVKALERDKTTKKHQKKGQETVLKTLKERERIAKDKKRQKAARRTPLLRQVGLDRIVVDRLALEERCQTAYVMDPTSVNDVGAQVQQLLQAVSDEDTTQRIREDVAGDAGDEEIAALSEAIVALEVLQSQLAD